MTQRYTRTSLLLLSTIALWEWYTAQSQLDGTLWHIILPSERAKPYIPTSELMAGFLSLLVTLSGVCLYWVVAEFRVSLRQALFLAVCVYLIASGSGLHVGCVITESNIRHLKLEVESLSFLLHVMHEYWAHNTFMLGFFGLMLLATWREVTEVFRGGESREKFGNRVNQKISLIASDDSSSAEMLTADTSTHRRQGLNGVKGNSETIVVNGKHTRVTPRDSTEHGIGYSVYKCIIQWVFPLQAGLYLSVFSTLTTTQLITTALYVSVLIMFISAYKKFKCKSFLSFLSLCDLNLVLLSSLVKASCVGIVVMVLYAGPEQ